MDIIQFIDQINSFLRDVVDYEEVINYIGRIMPSLQIRYSYDPIQSAEERDVMRVILSTLDNSRCFNNQFVNECNGVILGFYRHKRHWKCQLLARPPNVFRPQVRSLNMKEYDVYEAEDGTLITLYYLDKWLIGTRNGYDVGDMYWRGITFMEAFKEALDATIPDFDWEKLDKSTSYSIGFCHPLHHPFREDKRIWFVSAMNVEEYKMAENPGLPEQVKIECNDYNELLHKSKNAYKEYVDNGLHNFGYVLRYVGPKRNKKSARSDFFIESSLMHNIRVILYKAPTFSRIPEYRRMMKRLFTHIEYPLWLSYLTHDLRKQITIIFPKFKPIIDEFDSITASAVENISANKPQNELEKDLQDYVVGILNCQKGAMDKNIVRDAIMDPVALHVYIRQLYEWATID